MPAGYASYRWNNDKGYENLEKWVEKAASDARK